MRISVGSLRVTIGNTYSVVRAGARNLYMKLVKAKQKVSEGRPN